MPRLATYLKFDVHLSRHLREDDFFLLLYRAFIFYSSYDKVEKLETIRNRWNDKLSLQFTLRSLKSLVECVSDDPLPETLRNILHALSHRCWSAYVYVLFR